MTIGILYPGDMGAALSSLLRDAGHELVSPLDGRSFRTRLRAQEMGVASNRLDDLAGCRVLLSVVPPSAASKVAELVCPHAQPGALYVDLNAIGPETAERIGATVERAGLRFVDGAIHGAAARLRAGATLYLSGQAAGEAAVLFDGLMPVRVLGEKPGQASAFKMLTSGLSKGVCALFFEMALAAERMEMRDELLEAYRGSYPGIMELVDRMLPTYPQHAARRVDEMREVEATLQSLRLPAAMAAATAATTERLAEAHWPDAAGWTTETVLAAAA